MNSWTNNKQTDFDITKSINFEFTGEYNNPELISFFNELSNSLNEEQVPFSSVINGINSFFDNYNFINDKTDTRIIDNYRFARSYFNTGDYEHALKHINACINIIEEKNYDIHLYSLRTLLDKACEYEEKKKHITLVNKNKTLFLNSNNIGLEYLYLNKLIELEPNKIEYKYLLIEQLFLLNDYKSAKKHLNDITKRNPVFSDYVLYLYNRCKYNGNNNTKITKNKYIIESLYNDGNIKEALLKCEEYFNVSYDSYYLYMIGKMNYDLGMYEIAKDIFKKCMGISHDYIRECLTYLCYTSKKLNDEESYKKYFNECAKYYNAHDLNISRDNFETVLFNAEKSFDDKSCYYILKSCNNLSSNIIVNDNDNKLVGFKR